MMRFVYNVVTYLLSPVYGLYWIFRGIANRDYWVDLAQRFGFGCPQLTDGCIWIHAVSVGEVQASAPLVKSLATRFPDRQLLITTVTPTGRERAKRLFGNDVAHCYLPFETPMAVNHFFDATSPQIALIMETEIWPNLYYQLEQKSIPLLLVNARLSQKSLQGYLKMRALSRPAVRSIRHIAVQSERDAQRFQHLGARTARLSVMGNLKFEMHLPDDFPKRTRTLKDSLGPERHIWVAGSTHKGEDTQLLAAHRRVLESCAGALLVIAPRHPERASEIAALCSESGFNFRLSTEVASLADDVQVLIVDMLGELVYFYGVALAVFVGGSLVPAGGHNPIEAILAGAPIVTGPNIENFEGVYQDMIQCGAARMIETEHALADRMCAWFSDKEQRKIDVEAGLSVVENSRGALQHCLQLLEQTL